MAEHDPIPEKEELPANPQPEPQPEINQSEGDNVSDPIVPKKPLSKEPELKNVGDILKNGGPQNIIANKAASKLGGGEGTISNSINQVQQRFQKIQQRLLIVQKITSATAALLGNPITWIVLAIILLIVLFIVIIAAAFTLFGRNENGDGCGVPGESGSSSGISLDTDADTEGKAQTLGEGLMQLDFETGGLSTDQSAAIVGNLFQESGFDPEAVNPSSGAYGLGQWLGPRKDNLDAFAAEQGKEPSDPSLQLDFIAEELDPNSPYADQTSIQRLDELGWNEPGKTPEEYAVIWARGYERMGEGEANHENRGQMANTTAGLLGSSGTGASSGTGSGAGCEESRMGSSELSKDIVELAYQIAWPKAQKANAMCSGSPVGNVDHCKESATPEYVEAKEKAVEESPDGVGYNTCDRVVATVIKNTVDPEFPWGPTGTQGDYLASSDKWQPINTLSETEPGDVAVTQSDGHILIIGRDGEVIEGSITTKVAVVEDNYLTEDLSDGRQYIAYRYVG